MKKSLLKKTMLLLFALVTGSTCAWATTVTKTVNTLVTELGWNTSSGSTINGLYTSFALDENITISTSGEPNCGSVWGTTAKDWRLYQNKSGDVTVTAASGYTISSVTFTYNVKNSGTLKDGTTTVASASEQTVNAASKTFTVGNTGSATNGQVQITQFSVTYAPSSSKEPAGLSFAIPSYKVAYDTEFTQTVTNPNGLTVTYASSDETIAIVDENSGEVLVGDKAGTVTITASSAETATYAAGEATYTITVFDANAKGTEKNPYTVTEALTLIDALANNGKIQSVYVKGAVNEVTSFNSTYNSLTYYIEDLTDNTKTLYVYGGKNLGNTDFTGTSDLSVGDELVIFGDLQKYVKNSTTTPEFTSNNYIVQYKPDGSTTEVKAATITADKYKTYVSTENLLVPAGVTVYIATGETASTLTLTSVEKIKAGTPVILFSETANTYQFEITDDAVTYPATNLLKISDGTAVNGVFVLAKSGDNVGFYKWMGGALSAGRVYVDAPANAARDYLEFTFDDETTGLSEELRMKNEESAAAWYDLQGRKVAQPTKGLYIVNGKKVIIK